MRTLVYALAAAAAIVFAHHPPVMAAGLVGSSTSVNYMILFGCDSGLYNEYIAFRPPLTPTKIENIRRQLEFELDHPSCAEDPPLPDATTCAGLQAAPRTAHCVTMNIDRVNDPTWTGGYRDPPH